MSVSVTAQKFDIALLEKNFNRKVGYLLQPNLIKYEDIEIYKSLDVPKYKNITLMICNEEKKRVHVLFGRNGYLTLLLTDICSVLLL